MESIRIGSFNLYKYSLNSTKDLGTIASIIKDNGIDILAIQEIFSEQALHNLLFYLVTSNWDGRWASPESKSVSAAEGYAYVWNKNNVSLSRRKNGTVFEPVIHNQYPHKGGIELIRNPFYGRFLWKRNEMIEIRLINTHIMFSMSRDVNDSDDHDSSLEHKGDVYWRKREYSILSQKILPKLDDKVYDYQWDEVDMICRKPYTILLGDYNLNLRGSSTTDTFIEALPFVIKDSNSEKQIITVQNDLTTLKAKNKETGNIEGYRNNFDHFTYDKMRPFTATCWAVDAPHTYYGGDFDMYKDKVSDHLMIIMELEFV